MKEAKMTLLQLRDRIDELLKWTPENARVEVRNEAGDWDYLNEFHRVDSMRGTEIRLSP